MNALTSKNMSFPTEACTHSSPVVKPKHTHRTLQLSKHSYSLESHGQHQMASCVKTAKDCVQGARIGHSESPAKVNNQKSTRMCYFI